MIAALPMYDRPETAAAHDRLWTRIAARLRLAGLEAPDHLTRDRPEDALWRDPDLVLSQTCGLPFRLGLHREVALVGAPVHPLDVPPGYYRSVIVVRRGAVGRIADLVAPRLAVNSVRSQSGWAALFRHDPGFRPAGLVTTGSHEASARAVAADRADVASLDAVTWDMLRAFDEQLAASLAVIAITEPTPALPYICARRFDPRTVEEALSAGIADLTPADRATLRLSGVVHLPASAYLEQDLPPSPDEGLA